MNGTVPIAVRGAGLLTAVGLNAAASCAAFRAHVTNPTQTTFWDSNRNYIMAHQVPWIPLMRGLPRLAALAVQAIEQALLGLNIGNGSTVSYPNKPIFVDYASTLKGKEMALLLCVAEEDRPGRLEGLDDQLFLKIEEGLGVRFSNDSAVIAHGRVSAAIALERARELIKRQPSLNVLIAAADSLLTWPTLSHYDSTGRILREGNPDGFMPGEAAGALLLQAGTGEDSSLVIKAVGIGEEEATLESDKPFSAKGLIKTVKAALKDAGCALHEVDWRLSGMSGEQYYFKEDALMLTRILRVRRERIHLWYPALCTGEIGSVSGISLICWAQQAFERAYAPGPIALAHLSNDAGMRAAFIMQCKKVKTHG